MLNLQKIFWNIRYQLIKLSKAAALTGQAVLCFNMNNRCSLVTVLIRLANLEWSLILS